MNIKIAAERTGLTKKAIKYYESEGLISPAKNSENNYRDYSEQDIIKLNLIGALRAVDISISEIKKVTDGRKSIPEAMKDTLERINKDIESLEKSRIIVTNIIEKDLTDYNAAGEQIKKLRETLDLSMEERKEYLFRKLLRIFPGSFGEDFVKLYGQFLNVTTDTEEKSNAWAKLVEILDEFDEASRKNEVTSLINDYHKFHNEKITAEQSAKLASIINKISKFDALQTKEFAENAIKIMNSLESNNELKEQYKNRYIMPEYMESTFGSLFNQIGQCLAILSNDFKNYQGNIIKMNSEIQRLSIEETGMDMNAWVSKQMRDQ